MSRHKGRTATRLVERDFPHHVDMMVPEFGFGAHLNAMLDWHHSRGVAVIRRASNAPGLFLSGAKKRWRISTCDG